MLQAAVTVFTQNQVFPDDWLISFTPNHWCNEVTMEAYIRQVM